MFENQLTVPNMCWPSQLSGSPAGTLPNGPDQLLGRFATAQQNGNKIVLTRDPLGLNKLYFGFHPTRGLIAASYLIDLVEAGIPFRDTYAVPAGERVTIDLERRTSRIHRYDPAWNIGRSTRTAAATLSSIEATLRLGMTHLATTRPDAPIVVCLSGGADSSLIAAYAAQYLPGPITAYTYFHAAGEPTSADVEAASTVAQHLGFRTRLVDVDDDAILESVNSALIRGQDWRDFNVHAGIVNDQLARAIAQDHQVGPRPVVLTGDLMNELLADYSPIHYGGSTYYPLPQIPQARLRQTLVRGVQTGDREVGIFHAHGLDVIQPYGWAFHALLELPETDAKHVIIAALARGTLPDAIVRRPKIRAQIGDPTVERGILPCLLGAGLDQQSLEGAFCRAFEIDDPTDLRRTVRAGVHQPHPRNE
ncbi:asparagine synthase-related protein [Cryptosporangium sp. NPDC048952]|uniref:asparagine synthase-related protein n=1 Tax=Cryptosporangium sp. NPDC048952 TaxID=3363961 RepID=UPI003712F688